MPSDIRLLSLLGNVPDADGVMGKVALHGQVFLSPHGLEADNGIKEHYPDPECALLHYNLDHYAFWRQRYPALADALSRPGFFGENFSTAGLSEGDVCIGDIFQLGSAQIQVSWGRAACQKVAGKLGDPQGPEIMHRASRNGWFYRVLQAGETRAGDRFILRDRPQPDWALSRVQQALWGDVFCANELETIANIAEMAACWRELAREKLAKA